MNPSDVEIPLDDKKQSFLPKKQPFFPVLQSPSVAPSPPLSSSRKHFTCWDALYELIIIPFRFSQELQGPPTTINPGSGPDPTTMSSHVILDKVAVPTYASLGARSYFTLFIMWLMTCLCLDITQYYSTCAETDLISFFATLPTNPEDINIKTNLENTLKLVDVIEKNQKFNLLGSRTLRLSMLLALVNRVELFLIFLQP